MRFTYDTTAEDDAALAAQVEISNAFQQRMPGKLHTADTLLRDALTSYLAHLKGMYRERTITKDAAAMTRLSPTDLAEVRAILTRAAVSPSSSTSPSPSPSPAPRLPPL